RIVRTAAFLQKEPYKNELCVDGVADALHAVQQNVNDLGTGHAVVIDGIKDFLVNASAVSLQVVVLEQGVQLEGAEGHDLAVGLADQLVHSAGSLSGGQASLGSGDAALGTHDGSAFLVVQQVVDQHGSLGGMLAGLGDGQAHANLGEAAVASSELRRLSDGEAGPVLVRQIVLRLGSGRTPYQVACDHTGDPLVGRVSGGRTVVAVVGG